MKPGDKIRHFNDGDFDGNDLTIVGSYPDVITVIGAHGPAAILRSEVELNYRLIETVSHVFVRYISEYGLSELERGDMKVLMRHTRDDDSEYRVTIAMEKL